MHGATTTAKCATGVARRVITLKTATVSDIAATVHIAAMMVLTASAPMTSAMSLKTVRSILLTPTSSVATVPLLTMTLTSKGR